MPADSNPNTHSDTNSYSHAYADSDSDDNPNCNDYAHNDPQANAYTKSFSDTAAALDARAKTVIPRVISGR